MSDQSTPARIPLPVFELREIPGFPGYRVGDDGSVWSRFRRGGVAPGRNNLLDTLRKLRPKASNKTGHQAVTLCHEGRRLERLVHRLVLEAFVGPCPPGMECRHLDDNPSNNVLPNLRWGTQLENARDSLRNGRAHIGSRCHQAKLNEVVVAEIKRLLFAGKKKRAVARQFGLTPTHVRQIANGLIWKHVSITGYSTGEHDA